MKDRSDLGELLVRRNLIHLPAVEVGVCSGWFASTILSWGVPLLYLVDMWQHVEDGYAELQWSDDEHQETYEHCMSLMAEYEGKYRVLRGWAHLMAKDIPDHSLGFCHIDASHDYPNVVRDLRIYHKKLTIDGIMSGHDWPIEGVQSAVKDFADSNNLKINLLPVNDDDVSYWLERKV